MGINSRSLSLMFIVPVALFCIAVNTAHGDTFTPPAPDSKTLPANDGGPDGCNSSRFKCVMDGKAVLDKQTGLIWAMDTEIYEKAVSWEEAVRFCLNVEIGGQKGWRLPTKDELISILDTTQVNPALPEGHPFTKMGKYKYGGQGFLDYWTSTEYEDDNKRAWLVFISNGMVMDELKNFDFKVWPVRDGE